MKNFLFITLTLLLFSFVVPKLFAQINFTGPELLARPTDNSVTVNVVANAALEAYFEYGTTSGVYTGQTSVASVSANEPIEMVMDGLAANTLYYYRMVYSTDGGSTWINRTEHSFHTQRPPGSTFTFTITSDSHFGQYGGQTADEKDLYALTLQNAAQDHPDFHLDCGDTFAMDPSPLGTGMTVAEADNAYFIQRPSPYLGAICHSIPYFFVLGNHENEEGWNFDDVFTAPDQSLALVGMKARKKYFPNPVPDDFYSGNIDPLPEAFATATGDIYHEDYYAWEWGDALFVVIDPFHYSMVWPSEGDSYGGEGQDGEVGGDRWDWTLGIQQYLWLKSTLENSNAKFKFIFTHQVTGGDSPYGRGGIKAAPYFEWGGKNADGTWGWDTERPSSEGWDLPIHQLMVENGVSIFFHGHDHEYVYETLDGIVYLECPKPDDAGYTWQPYSYGHNENHYPDGLEIENSGHIRVTVSPDEVKTEYVRAYLPGDGENRVVAHTVIVEAPYTGPTHDLNMAVDPTEGGTTNPSVGVHTYAENAVVGITAIPAAGYSFDYWSGALSGSVNPTSITMDGDKSVTANFAVLPEYTLTVGNDGNGSVSLNPAGGTYASGTTVTLTPVPNLGYKFNSWTGANSGDVAESGGIYTIVMDADKSVSATFTETALYVDGAVSSTTTEDDVSSISFAHTTGTGVNRLMLVGVSWNSQSNERTISSVTFTPTGESAISLGLVITRKHSSQNRDAAIYGLIDPPSGHAGTVTITFSDVVASGIMAGAANFAGVDLTTPFGATNYAEGQSDAPRVTLTGLNGDELVFDNVFQGSGGGEQALTVGAGQTQLWNPPMIDYLCAAASTEQATGSSVEMSWTAAVSSYWVIVAVPINPAQTGPIHNLTMAVDPTEGGTTNPSVGVHTYAENAVVGITATPTVGYAFDHWSGALSGSVNPTSITMDGDKSVTANFAVGSPGILGDVNNDSATNSTDALIVLSCDVGLDVSQFCPMNCGDVNADGLVNSTDALIILSYDVGMSVTFPVGEPGCPSSVSPCPGCSP